MLLFHSVSESGSIPFHLILPHYLGNCTIQAKWFYRKYFLFHLQYIQVSQTFVSAMATDNWRQVYELSFFSQIQKLMFLSRIEDQQHLQKLWIWAQILMHFFNRHFLWQQNTFELWYHISVLIIHIKMFKQPNQTKLDYSEEHVFLFS